MKKLFLLFFLFPIFSFIFGQNKGFHFPSFDIVRTGPYVGIQNGYYTNLELGYEKQWKDLKLFGSRTSAIYGGFNYNLKHGVIGADLGAWRKLGFFGITYGAALIYRTDLSYSKFGISPTIGCKVGRFHILGGYQFFIPKSDKQGINEFYITLRFKIWNSKKIKRD